MRVEIPNLSLVMLIGPSGSGKSTFARKHFAPTEILSSDHFRGIVSDDERNQSVSKEAFAALHFVLEQRLKIGRLTVVDATNLQEDARLQLREIAKKYHVPLVGILMDFPEQVCRQLNELRGEEKVPTRVIRRHAILLRQQRAKIRKEFRRLIRFYSLEELKQVEIVRTPLKVDRRAEKGSFDIIGDVHGCWLELQELIKKLGYEITIKNGRHQVFHPDGRRLVFVGDLVDRGPDSPAVLNFVGDLVEQEQALAVMGNHDDKLLRKLNGHKVKVQHGLETTMEQLEGRSEEEIEKFRLFLEKLPSHYLLDEGKLVVAHAGLKEEYHGRNSGAVRSFALYGATTGKLDAEGYPERLDWAADYMGKALVVYGHTPQEEPYWINHTVNIDTGCVFGGRLTALRYPELQTLSVPAKRQYSNYRRSLKREENTDIRYIDVSKKRIHTRYLPPISIKENQAAPALEAISQFTVHPNWLIYLPPTMSPTETSQSSDYLEHPEEAFRYYEEQGVQEVICEEKHMGSRALLVVCRTPEVAQDRFRMVEPSYGVIYTRTGRRFFDKEREQQLLQRVSQAIDKANWWQDLQTDWVLLDAEILPWSEKAKELLRTQYAAVGSAATETMKNSIKALEKAKERGLDVDALLNHYRKKGEASHRFVEAYRRYCWEVESLEGIRIAPFHLLASERNVYSNQDHLWHMEKIIELCKYDPILQATNYRLVNLESQESIQKAIDWWLDLTNSGGEGMVVKPKQFLFYHGSKLIQPAIKCRGREYLRIIYGPEYTLPENMKRLRKRNVRHKRRLALQEFALGLEGLERLANREPLRRIHECVFGVLALEMEPVDPRL